MSDRGSQLGILPKLIGKAFSAYWRWFRTLSMIGMAIATCVTLVVIVLVLGALPFGIDTSGLQQLAGGFALLVLLAVILVGVIRGR